VRKADPPPPPVPSRPAPSANRSRRRCTRALGARAALALAAASALGCGLFARSEAPPAAREPPRRTVLATEWDDRRAGERAEKQAIAELGLLQDPALQAYVQEVGARVAAHARQTGFDYRFQVVDAWTPNAFAVPGGAIFVSRGLLALTNSEDELANVLAHEIVHVANRHAAAQQFVVSATPFAFGWWGAAQVAAYARDQEREADDGGQRLAAAAGYDPAAMASLLRALEQEERLQLGASRLPSFLQHHPANTERMAAAFARGAELRERRGAPARDPAAHLRRLEGLVVDANPAEGVFLGSRFVHPDLGFALSFPEGWKLVNTSRMVAAFSPQRNARFALEGAGPGDDPRVAAGRFLAGEALALGVEILAAQSLEIDGRPAYEVRGQAGSPNGAMAGQLTWIAHEGMVYRLSAAAPAPLAGRYFGRARAMARSFRAITPEERAAIRVQRLRVVPALPGEDLAALSRRTGNAWDPARTAVLNGLLPGAPLPEGRLVKIVISEPYRGRAAEAQSSR
jgi:predicted Zn-dependent protease